MSDTVAEQITALRQDYRDGLIGRETYAELMKQLSQQKKAPLPDVTYEVGNVGDEAVLAQGNQSTAVGAQGINSGDISDSVVNTGDHVTINPLPEDPAMVARRTYLSRFQARCNALPLDVIGEDEAEKRFGLDAVYIDLDTQTAIKLTDEEKKRAKYRRKKERPLAALEVTEQESRLVLLGAPGSGKSSFVRQLAAREAQKALSGAADARLPLFMTLRDLSPRLPKLTHDRALNEREKKSLIEAIFAQWQADLTELGGKRFAEDCLAEELNEGGVLLVFDGLDEVPEGTRQLVWLAIKSFLGQERDKPIDQIIVTCRIRSYSGDSRFAAFTAHTLAPFDKEKVHLFAKGWYEAQWHVGRLGEAEAKERTADLQQAATASQEMLELAENPLLLTTMAIIHQRETSLPRQRVMLYEQAVDVLLRRWQQRRGLAIDPKLRDLLDQNNKIRPLLERLAYDLHQLQSTQEGARLDYGYLLNLLENDPNIESITLAKELLNYIDLRAGLLVGHGGGLANDQQPPRYDFPHRTFQEYLAGCYLVKGLPQQILKQLFSKANEGDYWGLAVQLGLEELHFNRRNHEGLSVVANALLVSDKGGERTHLWSAFIADIVELEQILVDLKELGIPLDYPQRLQGVLRDIIVAERSSLSLTERKDVGVLINLMGDLRSGVGLRVDGLPDIAWGREVPVGHYSFVGEDGYTVKNGYQLAQYPVTDAQFQAFLDAGGEEKDVWWQDIPDRYRKAR